MTRPHATAETREEGLESSVFDHCGHGQVFTDRSLTPASPAVHSWPVLVVYTPIPPRPHWVIQKQVSDPCVTLPARTLVQALKASDLFKHIPTVPVSHK